MYEVIAYAKVRTCLKGKKVWIRPKNNKVTFDDLQDAFEHIKKCLDFDKEINEISFKYEIKEVNKLG